MNEHECIHRWQIERPSGPTSQGTCKHCGQTRQFHNDTEDLYSGYNGERPVHHISLSKAQKLSQPLMRVNQIVW